MNDKSKVERIGEVGVDAGLLMIADPCYWLGSPKRQCSAAERFPEGWEQFCNELGNSDAHQLTYPMGHAGLGVTFQSGYGDGTYPVYAMRNREGRTVAALVLMDGLSAADLHRLADEVAKMEAD